LKRWLPRKTKVPNLGEKGQGEAVPIRREIAAGCERKRVICRDYPPPDVSWASMYATFLPQQRNINLRAERTNSTGPPRVINQKDYPFVWKIFPQLGGVCKRQDEPLRWLGSPRQSLSRRPMFAQEHSDFCWPNKRGASWGPIHPSCSISRIPDELPIFTHHANADGV
jgi:hypothetical protein